MAKKSRFSQQQLVFGATRFASGRQNQHEIGASQVDEASTAEVRELSLCWVSR